MFKFLFKDGGLLGGGVGGGGLVWVGMFLLCSYYVFHRLVNLFTVGFLCVIVRPWDCPLNRESHGQTVTRERSVTGFPSVGCFPWCQRLRFWSKLKCWNTWMFFSMDKTMLFHFQWSLTGCLIYNRLHPFELVSFNQFSSQQAHSRGRGRGGSSPPQKFSDLN